MFLSALVQNQLSFQDSPTLRVLLVQMYVDMNVNPDDRWSSKSTGYVSLQKQRNTEELKDLAEVNVKN